MLLTNSEWANEEKESEKNWSAQESKKSEKIKKTSSNQSLDEEILTEEEILEELDDSQIECDGANKKTAKKTDKVVKPTSEKQSMSLDLTTLHDGGSEIQTSHWQPVSARIAQEEKQDRWQPLTERFTTKNVKGLKYYASIVYCCYL